MRRGTQSSKDGDGVGTNNGLGADFVYNDLLNDALRNWQLRKTYEDMWFDTYRLDDPTPTYTQGFPQFGGGRSIKITDCTLNVKIEFCTDQLWYAKSIHAMTFWFHHGWKLLNRIRARFVEKAQSEHQSSIKQFWKNELEDIKPFVDPDNR